MHIADERLDTLLSGVEKPGRYIGGEWNSTVKDWNAVPLRIALGYPDVYEIGMSNMGLAILYELVNEQPDMLAERFYTPWADMDATLRRARLPLYSLETHRPLHEFDLLGISLQHELTYSNVLTTLDLAGIPLLAQDRGDDVPLIMAGGSCCFNPEPMAAFLDLCVIGDGESAIIQIARTLLAARQNGSHTVGRQALLERLATIPGVYVPSLYEPRYRPDGTIDSLAPLSASAPTQITKALLPELTPHPRRPIVPTIRVIHDRGAVEIQRGCSHGCRFCQAGMIYRPIRERSHSDTRSLVDEVVANTGYDEIGMVSLSSSDHSAIGPIVRETMHAHADRRLSVSLPSLRIDSFSVELAKMIQQSRKTGFTFAPEAGSQRLRDVINKGVSEQDLFETAAAIFREGWDRVKLYFMIGLPTETDEDLEAIAELVEKTRKAGHVGARGRQRISVSVGTFVPKPHTPFQWHRQLSMDESRERLSFLKSRLHRKSVTLKYHDPQQSYLEGIFSRGDRRLTPLIVEAWRHGARLDSWSDYFNLERWREAADRLAIDLDFYLRDRSAEAVLPWSHIDSLVSDEFLREEQQKSLRQEYTPDCRYHACQKCGLCDFESVKPIVHNRKRDEPAPAAVQTESNTAEPAAGDKHHHYLVTYSRTGPICYLGHLEFLQIIHRSLRRARIKTHFSHGFNPSPKVSFGPALPVGTNSDCEFFSMDLIEPLHDFQKTRAALNRSLPAGIQIIDIRPMGKHLPQHIASTYEIGLPEDLGERERELIGRFDALPELVVERERKGKRKQVNLRPLVKQILVKSADTLIIEIITKSGQPGTRPSEVLAALLHYDEEALHQIQVTKRSWTELTA